MERKRKKWRSSGRVSGASQCTNRAHARRRRGAFLMLRVKVVLDEAKRGRVFGARGAVVKQIQRDTGSQVRIPRRGDKQPIEITGPNTVSVLRGCCLVARKTCSACECTVSLVGSPEVRATLQVTNATTHRLIDVAAGSKVAFVVFCFPATSDSELRAQAAIDDAKVAADTAELQCFASVQANEVYLYGHGDGAATACKIYETLATAPSPKPLTIEEIAVWAVGDTSPIARRREGGSRLSAFVDHGAWQAVLLSGSLVRSGMDHGIIEAAMQGKTGLGPAAKPLNMRAIGGELYLVDAALLKQLDELLGMQDRVRLAGVVEEQGAGRTTRTSKAWIYRLRTDGCHTS